MIDMATIKQWDIVEIIPGNRYGDSYTGKWYRVCSKYGDRYINSKNAGCQAQWRPEDAKRVGRLDTYNRNKQAPPRPSDYIYIKGTGMGEVISCDGTNVVYNVRTASRWASNTSDQQAAVSQVTRLFRRTELMCSFEL